MIFRRWATRGLRSGDLSALAVIASGGAKPADGCAERLRRRGFIRQDADGQCHVTLRGQFALMIRRAMN